MFCTIAEAASVIPSSRQLAWQRMEFYGFLHITVNTFTDKEWGDGTEDPTIFNPTALDAAQWVGAMKEAGMTGVIISAKHHDGFCLWPSRFTEHSVKNSPWRNGNGDIIAETARACRDAGMRMGIYLSPWDRHEACYGDSPRYNTFFENQLRELLTGYGEIFCVWFDGACGEGPNGKRQIYDWNAYYKIIRELQPQATIHICGPDVRWCGNEAGHCRTSEWSVVPGSLLDREKIAEESQKIDDPDFAKRVTIRNDDLGSREIIAKAERLAWFPAEVDTSIRPGWFYHAHEDDKVRSLNELIDIYFNSVGGNSCLLLNVPPDRRGLLHENDVSRLREIGKVLSSTFAKNLASGASIKADHTRSDGNYEVTNILDGNPDTFWTTENNEEEAIIEIDLGRSQTFNVISLQEHIQVGQRVEKFRVLVFNKDNWSVVAESTTIGYKRLLRIDTQTTNKVRIEILKSRIAPTLSSFGLYYNQDLQWSNLPFSG